MLLLFLGVMLGIILLWPSSSCSNAAGNHAPETAAYGNAENNDVGNYVGTIATSTDAFA